MNGPNVSLRELVIEKAWRRTAHDKVFLDRQCTPFGYFHTSGAEKSCVQCKVGKESNRGEVATI